MKFATVDNDPNRLAQLSKLLKSVFPNCTVTEFTDPLLSAKYILNNEVDAVLAETVMRPADGPTLKKVLLTNKPDLNVVLLTDHPLRRATDNADPMTLRRSVTADALRAALETGEKKRNLSTKAGK